jgi:hypothetical protein
MCLFKTKFIDLVHIIYTKGKVVAVFVIDETAIKMAANTFSYGFVLKKYILLWLESIFQKKHVSC